VTAEDNLMVYRSGQLPSRFPVGTKFVIEGRPAKEGEVQVIRRYVEFPDGSHLRLPARPAKTKVSPLRRRARHAPANPTSPAGNHA
jgi:hypothetical protein